jgi:hypothetical protein
MMTPMQPEGASRPALVAGEEWNWLVSALRRHGPAALLFGAVTGALAAGIFLLSPRQYRSVALIEPPAVPYLDEKAQVQVKSLVSAESLQAMVQERAFNDRIATATGLPVLRIKTIDARVPRSTSLLSLSIVSSTPATDRRQLAALLEAIRSHLQPRLDLEKSNLHSALIAAQAEVEDFKVQITNFGQGVSAIAREQAILRQQIQTARKKIEDLETRQIRATERAGSEPALTALLYSNNLANLQQYVDSLQNRLTYDLKRREIEILNSLSTARRGLDNARSNLALREALMRSLRGFSVVQPAATIARPVGWPIWAIAAAAFFVASAGYFAGRLALAALMSPGAARP